MARRRQPITAADEDEAPRLSHERILRTAIDLADREGEEALSMRRIAQELDVWPMSLYRYFHDKDALLDALAQAAAASVSLPSTRSSPRRQLRQLLLTVKTTIQEHPGGKHLRLTGSKPHSAADPITQRGLDVLIDTGLEPIDAKAAWEALVHYATGAAAANAGDEFAYGLDLFLDGLQPRATNSSSPEHIRVSPRARPSHRASHTVRELQ